MGEITLEIDYLWLAIIGKALFSYDWNYSEWEREREKCVHIRVLFSISDMF